MATLFRCECGDEYADGDRSKVEAWFAEHVRRVHAVEPLRVWASYAPKLSQRQDAELRKLLRSWGAL